MPPKTRRGRAALPSQTTLSFNSKSAKVTKPTHETPSTKDSKSKSRLSDIIQESIVDEIATPDPTPTTATDLAADEQTTSTAPAAVSSPTPRKKKRTSAGTAPSTSSREAAAAKVTDAQIKKYWQREEDSRLAPRVHQQHLPLHEKILRHFDLSTQFGSCIGITRLARWKRADGLGLEPPVEVLAVLEREMEENRGGKGKGRSQGCGMVAYIDELGGGRVGVVDA